VDRLKSKVALVTAAGQGIGRAIAAAFAAEGARVIATDLEAMKLDGLTGKRLKLDVRSTKDVNAAANEITRETGPLNILVNCAGYVHQGNVLECGEDEWDLSFDLNVKSIHRMLSAFLPDMLQNGGGSIVNISSVVSSIRGVPNRYAYGATKAAVIGLTKAVAADFIKQGIRANAICPGTIQSPSLEQRVAALAKATGQSLEDIHQGFVDRQPLGRLGTPAEVAALAVFLASDESGYITGQAHLVDGGMAL
jgi:2-keto-3-deoxy-L-fuconate dehydrogenase